MLDDVPGSPDGLYLIVSGGFHNYRSVLNCVRVEVCVCVCVCVSYYGRTLCIVCTTDGRDAVCNLSESCHVILNVLFLFCFFVVLWGLCYMLDVFVITTDIKVLKSNFGKSGPLCLYLFTLSVTAEQRDKNPLPPLC